MEPGGRKRFLEGVGAGILLAVVVILGATALFRPTWITTKGHRCADETNAIASLKAYVTGQRQFKTKAYATGPDTPRFAANLGELWKLWVDGRGIDVQVLPEAMVRATGIPYQGYLYLTPGAGQPSLSAPEAGAVDWTERFELLAVPAQRDNVSRHCFFVDQTGVVRMKDMGQTLLSWDDFLAERPYDPAGGWVDA